jgi:hypothetical protein
MSQSQCDLSRGARLQRVGNLAQLGGTRQVILNEGAAKGMAAIDVDTGAGLRFTILPDRGMDISLCSYKGTNLVFLTSNGEVNPAFYDAAGLGWLHTFFAGLLTTCGLTTIGAPGRDGDTELGLHGRYNATPARRVQDRSRWEGERYVIEVTGVVEETRLFDHSLELTRTIRTGIGSRSLSVCDRIVNTGYGSSPCTILYHVNAGFPLLDQDSVLALTAARTEVHDETSRAAFGDCRRFSAPVPGYAEQNFLHQMTAGADGKAHAGMLNPTLAGGLGLVLNFDPQQFPYLNEWKMMGQRDYVVGIEPCNAPCANRAVLRRAGLLPLLEPGESREFDLEFQILEGHGELEAFRQQCGRPAALERFTSL